MVFVAGTTKINWKKEKKIEKLAVIECLDAAN